MSTLTSQLIISLIDRVSGPARAAAGALGGITRTIGEANRLPVAFSDRLDGALASNRRSLDSARAGVLDAVGGFYALREALGGPIMAAAEFESAMADVRKVVDFPTPEAFAQFRDDLMGLSREIPTSVNGLAEIAAAAGQAGIAGDDLIRFTEAASKIGVAFDIGADQAGGSMANLMTALGMTIDETVLLADAMNHLSNNQASSAAEILDVVQRVGAQASMFGFTAEQTAAFASAMVAAGAQSDVAATSFRNMGAALTRGASATSTQRSAFRALGLDAEQVARSMQENAVETTTDVLRRIAQLPAEQQAAISSQLFGNEARALGPLLTNLDLVDETLGLIADQSQYAGSAFREFMARNDTFLANMQRFKNVVTGLGIAIGDALLPAISRLAEMITPVIIRLTELATAYPEVTTAIAGSAAAFVGFGAAMAGLRFAGLLGANGALSLLAGAFRSISLVARAGPLLAVGAALSFLRQNWDGIVSGAAAFRDAFAGGIEAAGPAMASVSSAVQDALGWLEALTGPIDPARWQSWGAAAGSAAAEVVSALSRAVVGAVEFGRELVIDPGAALARAAESGRAIAQGVLDGLSARWAAVAEWLSGLDLDFGSLAASAGVSLGALGADVANTAIAAIGSGWASLTAYIEGLNIDWPTVGASFGAWQADVANAAIAAIGSGWTSLMAYIDGLNIDWSTVGASVAGGVVAIASGVGEAAIAAITFSWSSLSTFVSGLDIDWSQVAANIILGVPSVAYGLGSALVQAMAGAYSAVHDWASTVTVDWGAVGETIGSGVGKLVGVVGGFLYDTFTEIWTGVSTWLASDGPGVDWGGAASALVDAVFDGIGAAWGAYSDFVMGLLRGLFGEIPPEVFEAGANLIQRLKDGAVQQFDDFLSWVGGIPGRIIEAIGSIDLSSLIDFGEPPRWLKWLMGEDEGSGPPSLEALPADQRAAADALTAARESDALPSADYLAELEARADGQRQIIAELEADLAASPAWTGVGNMLDRRDERLDGAREELAAITAEQETAQAKAGELQSALALLGSTEANPEISTASIDAALAQARALSAELQGLNSPAANPASSGAEIDGARAKGGPVSRGGTYLVGEEGPELITATRNGYVHPTGEGPMAPPAAASAPPSITVQVGDIVVSPTISTTERVDPAQLSQELARQMRDEVREAFRGVFADTGMRFA
jgi:TP901 family phage tail tape measure protein